MHVSSKLERARRQEKAEGEVRFATEGAPSQNMLIPGRCMLSKVTRISAAISCYRTSLYLALPLLLLNQGGKSHMQKEKSPTPDGEYAVALNAFELCFHHHTYSRAVYSIDQTV